MWMENNFMTLTERSEMLSQLFKLRSELGALYSNCLETRALVIGTKVQTAQASINEALEEFQPEPNFPSLNEPRRF